ncbi:MAG: FHA domain-containing protein [Polyangiales bacterium]
MRHGVNATQCRAAGLPEVSFSVDLDEMTAAPRPGAYLSGVGSARRSVVVCDPPGVGPGRGGPGAHAALALPTQDRSVALQRALAGSLRPCLVAVAGQEYGRVAAMAALVVDPRACPQGMIVVAARDGRGVAQPTLDAPFHSGPLRTLSARASSGEPPEVAPEAEGVLTLRGPQGVTQHPLRGPRVLLGRSQHADVVLFDARVSRQHAVLEHRGEGWVLVIVPNAQGVTVRGALRAQGEYLLTHGESFELGETVAHLALNARHVDASPWQRLPALEARFESWNLPAPKIPHGVSLDESPTGLRPPVWVTSSEPRLEISWREGEGIEGLRVAWSSRTWSIVLEGPAIATSQAHAHLASLWRALGAVLCDAMSREAPGSSPARVTVVARSPAQATWTTPFGGTRASPTTLDALLDALAARRALDR